MSTAPTSGEPDEERELALAAAAGIHRLAIPTPFRVGRINAYLIEDSPLTLIDSGPNSAKALDELEQALAVRGHRVEDLELLIVSHQHLDHFGLASILARRSGADVAALDALAPYLADYGGQADADDSFAQQIMLRHGIPAEIVTALRAVSAGFRGWGAAVDVTRTLRDGEQLRLRDRTLTVLHRPGHSPSDTVFLDERPADGERSILLGADHLIKHISSNPLLTRPLGSEPDYAGPRPQALLTYINSLQKTRAMELSLVLPGHGPPISGHAELIDQRMRMHERRAAKILRLISAQPSTAHEIAHELWGDVAVTQAYLTLSEVLGHVDLLLADGSVVELERDGVVRFAAAQ
ncbi:MAG: beta-lactamase domain protein [Solirubrobacterales bacterium]|nr:beta-lactamase domain protein [Solirubrobacterales bacterium]